MSICLIKSIITSFRISKIICNIILQNLITFEIREKLFKIIRQFYLQYMLHQKIRIKINNW